MLDVLSNLSRTRTSFANLPNSNVSSTRICPADYSQVFNDPHLQHRGVRRQHDELLAVRCQLETAVDCARELWLHDDPAVVEPGVLEAKCKLGRTLAGRDEPRDVLDALHLHEHVLPFGALPQTRHVRGSNMTFIGIAADRIAGRAIIGSALDNLTKGASGQAVQNMNVMLGFPETMGLEQVALFP